MSIAKSILADVNVWLATLVAEHPHHADRMDHAQAWAAVSSVAAQDAVGFENEPDGIEEHLAALVA